MMVKLGRLLLLTLLFSTVPAEDNESLIEVEPVLCRSVEGREPIGEDTVFLSDVERVYCWTLVTGATGPTTVAHMWHYGTREMASVELEISSEWFRTWSYKTILPEWTGDWCVRVYDGEGNLLGTSNFKILPGETE